MRRTTGSRPTIGFLSTWSVYEGTTIDGYSHALLQGICAASRQRDCNLLLGCGIGLPASPLADRTVWAVLGAGVDFVPVGPWNTDGLIIIPDDLSSQQFEYVQDLMRGGFPIILTTSERPGPLVAVDNAGGIKEALNHLQQHGHRQIAFIAGKSGRGGDSAERLAAYRQTLREADVEEDARLIAFGELRREDGRTAMERIIATGAPFTAVLASNDLSGLGAMDALRAAGRRVPDDVAMIGFDDVLAARSQSPPLTTIRHPTFELGYQAVLTLLDVVDGKRTGEIDLRLPTQMVIRQSCGCRPESQVFPPGAPTASADLQATQTELANAMAQAVLREARHSRRDEIVGHCASLAGAFTSSLSTADTRSFDAGLKELVQWLELEDEDAYAWQAAISTLHRGSSALLPCIRGSTPSLADLLIDRARLAVGEQVQRQTTGALVKHMEMSNRLGLMTSQLLAALDATATTNILAHHLPQLGIDHALVALYASRADDPFSLGKVLFDVGLKTSAAGREFPTREFPPSDFYPSDRAFQLAILPLVIDERNTGWAAFSATNLEPCAAIVHNLASALRTGRLYLDALEGRKLAEEANRLKSRFLSTVSHELRTPLSLIVGLSDMALRNQNSDAPLPETTRRDIKQIHLSAQHLSRLIGDVLDLASSEAGQLRLLREPLDLAEVLSAVAPIGAEMADEKKLRWQADIPAHGPWVRGDRTRLRQIVLNLISNAVKFTPSGMVALQVHVSDDDRQVTIEVSDTGIGVSPADQADIFREFHRSERTIQSGYAGLGLGLAICKQLVERMDGTVGVRSPGDLSSGSTFYFTLPTINVPASQQAAGSEIPLEAHQGTVVVLTETPRSERGERVCAHLRDRGLSVQLLRADPSADWLTPLLKTPPAAIVLDQEMAAHHGWALLEMLKRAPTLKDIPILAYSIDLEHDRGEWLELNYRSKPLAPQQLEEELARLDDRASRTVLVVDDDPGILDLHCRLVEQAGCRSVCARNGREALAAVGASKPDLILLDLMMPELDGFGVLDALRAREATRGIPVIVLTARLLDEADVERLNRGVASILSKGLFTTAETLNHIEAALARQHSLGAPTQRLVRRAMGFIHAHYAEPLTREQIASHVNISPDYLTDCFRQELGVTPMVYLNRYRIRQARELLENDELTITQIALAVGFSESAHFTRAFQREVGVTPRAYRRGDRGQPAT